MKHITITAQEREQAFRRDLEELLKKHDAELDIDIESTGSFFIPHKAVASVTMQSKFNESGEVTEEYAVFDL
jgi:hypothetical protein